jgi:hypothetical protein
MRKDREESKLLKLPAEQRAQVDQWLFAENAGIRTVAERCQTEFGQQISRGCVQRYCRKERLRREAAGEAAALVSGMDAETVYETVMRTVGAKALRMLRNPEPDREDQRTLAEYLRVMIARRRESNEARRLELTRTKVEFDAATACAMHRDEMQAIDEANAADTGERVTAFRESLFGKNLPQ